MVWRVAITVFAAEFEAADELRLLSLDVFLPYTHGKVRVKLPTRGRALYKVEVRDTPRWPRYIFADDFGDISRILVVRTIRAVVSFGGEAAAVAENLIAEMRRNCAPDGRIRKHAYLVGDILNLIAPSPLAGLSGVVLSLGDTSLRMAVDGHTVTTPYAETSPA